MRAGGARSITSSDGPASGADGASNVGGGGGAPQSTAVATELATTASPAVAATTAPLASAPTPVVTVAPVATTLSPDATIMSTISPSAAPGAVTLPPPTPLTVLSTMEATTLVTTAAPLMSTTGVEEIAISTTTFSVTTTENVVEELVDELGESMHDAREAAAKPISDVINTIESGFNPQPSTTDGPEAISDEHEEEVIDPEGDGTPEEAETIDISQGGGRTRQLDMPMPPSEDVEEDVPADPSRPLPPGVTTPNREYPDGWTPGPDTVNRTEYPVGERGEADEVHQEEYQTLKPYERKEVEHEEQTHETPEEDIYEKHDVKHLEEVHEEAKRKAAEARKFRKWLREMLKG